MGLDPLNIGVGIATNLATDILKHYAQYLDGTLAGRGLKAIGLIEPTREDLLREVLEKALQLYFTLYPAYDISGVFHFFCDPITAQQLGNYLFDHHPIDQQIMEAALVQHLQQDAFSRLVLQKRGGHIERIVPDFLACYRQTLKEQTDVGERVLLLTVLDATDTMIAELRSSEARIKALVIEALQAQNDTWGTLYLAELQENLTKIEARYHLPEEIAIYCQSVFQAQREALIEQVIHLSGKSYSHNNLQEDNPLSLPIELLEDLFGDLLPPKEEHNSKQKPEFILHVRDKLLELRRGVVLGNPGSGKTTMLKRLTLDYIQRYQKDTRVPLPIFVPLSQFTGQTSFTEFAYHHLSNLRPFLNHLSLVWIFDALNEMPRYGSPPQERSLVNELVDFVRQHDRCRFVISCRVRDYQNELGSISDLYQIELQDLNPRQIHDIIFRRLPTWTGKALWKALRGSNTLIEAWELFQDPKIDFWQGPSHSSWYDIPDKVKNRYRRRAQEYQAKDPKYGSRWYKEPAEMLYYDHQHAREDMLSDPRKLMALCRNPYNLGVIIDLTTRGGIESIPSNRGLLFERFTRLLLQREETQAQRQGDPWSKETITLIRWALQSIAVSMAGQRSQISKQDAMKLLGDLNTEDLLLKAEKASIIKYGNTIRFTHQLLQEFFASGSLLEAIASGQPATLFWPIDRWWLPQGWEETAIILSGYTDLYTSARWLAVAHPLLAERCLRENEPRSSPSPIIAGQQIDLGFFALRKLEELTVVMAGKEANLWPSKSILASLIKMVYFQSGEAGTERLTSFIKNNTIEPFRTTLLNMTSLHKQIFGNIAEMVCAGLPYIIHSHPQSREYHTMAPQHRETPLMLHIDDDKMVLVIAKRMIQQSLSIMVVTCERNLEAMLYTIVLRPDFILSDVLRGEGGIEGLVDLLKISPETATIPISVASISHLPEILKTRINYFIRKPFERDVLLELINCHLQGVKEPEKLPKTCQGEWQLKLQLKLRQKHEQ